MPESRSFISAPPPSAPPQPGPGRGAKVVWGLLLGALLGLGVCGSLFWLPFETLRPLADPLAKDGSLDWLSAARYAALHTPARLLGLGCLGLVFASLARVRLSWQWIQRGLLALAGAWRRIQDDQKELLSRAAHSSLPRAELYLLAGITLAAVVARLVIINKPLNHDESYTYVAFASRTLIKAISDYSLPNNHVLHTIGVHFSTLLFGPHPWAVRLPTFLAGVLMVPAAFWLARAWYGRAVAWLTAGMVALYPILVSLSTDARGYTLLALISLLVYRLGLWVLENDNRAAWAWLALLAALGFYTVPIMLYPFGALMGWLFLSALCGDVSQEYPRRKWLGLNLPWGFLGCWLAAGLSAGVLALIFYSPILFTSGLGALTGNSFVLPLTWDDFVVIAPQQLHESWVTWFQGLPWGDGLLAVGFVASILFAPWIDRRKVPIQAVQFLWIAVLLVVQRTIPWPKLWIFLLPLFTMWSLAGLLLPVEKLSKRFFRSLVNLKPFSPADLLALVGLSIVMGLCFSNAATAYTTVYGRRGDVEEMTLYIKERLQPGEVVVVTSPDDAPMWYYFRYHQIPDATIHGIKSLTPSRAFIVVDPSYEQTPQSVWHERGPQAMVLPAERVQLVKEFERMILYEMVP